MPGIKCKGKHENGNDCKLLATPLSMQDSPNYKDGVIVDYWRTTTYKCPNGHTFKQDSIYTPKPAEPKTPTRKKPTQKGYNHIQGKRNIQPKFPPNTSNKMRMTARAQRREQIAEYKRTIEAKQKEAVSGASQAAA